MTDFIFQNTVQSYYTCCFVICFFPWIKYYHVSKYSATYFLVIILKLYIIVYIIMISVTNSQMFGTYVISNI